MNLFNYQQRVPHFKNDLLEVVGNLLGSLKIDNSIKSKNSIIKSLYDFHHSVRYTFGLLSYDEIRKYLSNKIPIDEFNV